MNRPRWTVLANIVNESDDDFVWIGKSWQFFDTEEAARDCYIRHTKVGNVPTMRPFYKKVDINHIHCLQKEID